jgi:hypothetical protein
MVRLIRSLPLIVFALLTTACSVAGLGYSALPGLGVFTLDRYFNFDDSQRDFVRLGLNDLQKWHRTKELPEYKRLLVNVKQRNQKSSVVQSRAQPTLERAD